MGGWVGGWVDGRAWRRGLRPVVGSLGLRCAQARLQRLLGLQRLGLRQPCPRPLRQSWNETVAMWEAHRSNGEGHECTHYCRPSAMQARREGGQCGGWGAAAAAQHAAAAQARARGGPLCLHDLHRCAPSTLFTLLFHPQSWIVALYRTLQQDR